ncbi:methyltransferase domain-containing protein [Nonomuraea sp. FMUSA5-5]|uniref:Methyltransferase domain-containing protein n=1 Tax=Nonomuraea composti TaxID=2720023 RepID=A0ABX1B6P0_9ACTN|nr:methyltransferase domain-containing protein [Nonomuraea sp. FMUSA5-5]NJP92507.1 methyltransferase domain-containing protein [Nonomuraea sp. FMUSA5-5]
MIDNDSRSRPDPIAYLDHVAAGTAGRDYKQQVLELMDLHRGQTVLDLGCGPGTDLAAMATAVAPAGQVIGVDRDPLMVAEARARLAGRPSVEIRSGDVHALPLDDGSVDRARTDRVLQHVADPTRVLAELRRVARPGARIVMAEPDWEGLLIDSPQPAMSRGLVRFLTTEIIRNPAIGRGLARLCREAGLVVRSVITAAPVFRDFTTADHLFGLRRNVARAIDAGYLTQDAEEWIDDLSSQPFLASALLFLVVAEIPG